MIVNGVHMRFLMTHCVCVVPNAIWLVHLKKQHYLRHWQRSLFVLLNMIWCRGLADLLLLVISNWAMVWIVRSVSVSETEGREKERGKGNENSINIRFVLVFLRCFNQFYCESGGEFTPWSRRRHIDGMRKDIHHNTVMKDSICGSNHRPLPSAVGEIWLRNDIRTPWLWPVTTDANERTVPSLSQLQNGLFIEDYWNSSIDSNKCYFQCNWKIHWIVCLSATCALSVLIYKIDCECLRCLATECDEFHSN